METTSVHVCLQICKYRLGLHFYMRCHIKHWSEVIVPYSLAGHSPIVEATGETIVVYALYLTSQFRWSHHWAVTLSRWPCLLYSSASVGRGRKKNPWHCSKRVGDVGPDVMVYLTCAVIGLGGRGVIKTWTEVAARVRLYMLTSDLTSLVPPQFSHWLQVRKVGTAYIFFNFENHSECSHTIFDLEMVR